MLYSGPFNIDVMQCWLFSFDIGSSKPLAGASCLDMRFGIYHHLKLFIMIDRRLSSLADFEAALDFLISPAVVISDYYMYKFHFILFFYASYLSFQFLFDFI